MNNVNWVPLDLPPIPKEITLENISQLFDFIPNVSTEERKLLAEQRQFYKYAWNSFRLRYPTDQKTGWAGQNLDVEWSWTESAKTNCPLLISYIETYLPFKKIKAASVMSSTGSVPLHLDMSLNASEEEKINYKLYQCKEEAKKRIATTDWAVLPDVGLANVAAFETYRAALRELIKNPVAEPTWPTEPEPIWS